MDSNFEYMPKKGRKRENRGYKLMQKLESELGKRMSNDWERMRKIKEKLNNK